MSIAYVDTSALVAIAFEEPGGSQASERLEGFSRLLSSNLLEAELRAVFARERQGFDAEALSRIEWILPDRRLAIELARALKAGYLRGADLWHIATALYVAPKADEIGFVTLDGRQRDVASALGFQVGTGWPTVDSGFGDEQSSAPDIRSEQRS